MRKRFLAFATAILLALILIPLPAFATSYIASRNSDVFHESSCFYVNRIYDSNKVYYSTAEEAISSGKRGCSRCNPAVGVTSSNQTASDSASYSSAYGEGYKEGLNIGMEAGRNAGREVGYKTGYETGYETGYKAGQADMQTDMQAQVESQIETAKKEATFDAYLISVVFGAPVVAFITAYLMDRSHKKQTPALQCEPGRSKQGLNHVNNHITSQKDCGSTAFSFIDYQNTVLILVFRTGGEYHYYNVPKEVYEGLMAAPSKGGYYHENIKDKYPYY